MTGGSDVAAQGTCLECDIAIVGGSMGGVAAALAAVDAGATVILSEATDWLGGQMTNQGVSALDEHRYIEAFGGTRSYSRLREMIRAAYRQRYDLASTMPDGKPLNPGNAWVSALCFEPRVGVQVLQEMLQPGVEAGRLTVLTGYRPVGAQMAGERVAEVALQPVLGGQAVHVCAAYYLDATDLGDLLPLTGTAYVSGAEAQADTHEPHASVDGSHPDETQGFTYCFAVEHCPGEDHTILKPTGYELYRDRQPYTFVLRGHHGEARPFEMFTTSAAGLPPFWTYRRLLDGALIDPSGQTPDLALINWPGNDYHWANVIDRPAAQQARILGEAKQLALGFLYWLQTEAPHADGAGRGYPGLRLRPEVMGTADGLSKAPYIRESRRIRALKRIVEGEIAAEGRREARADRFADAVGIGWYAMDLHDCVGRPTSVFAPTRPFQIPLGVLIPQHTSNLLAACKNIGTTHLTNGAYRLHPVEWNVGEAAGALAAFCLQQGVTPQRVWREPRLLRRFQRLLLERGVPLAWTIDVPPADPLFVPAQQLLVAGAVPDSGPRAERLDIRPEEPLSNGDAAAMFGAAGALLGREGMLCLPAGWQAQPQQLVSGGKIRSLLALWGLPAGVGDDPPSWRALVERLAPWIAQASSSAPKPGEEIT